MDNYKYKFIKVKCEDFDKIERPIENGVDYFYLYGTLAFTEGAVKTHLEMIALRSPKDGNIYRIMYEGRYVAYEYNHEPYYFIIKDAAFLMH